MIHQYHLSETEIAFMIAARTAPNTAPSPQPHPLTWCSTSSSLPALKGRSDLKRRNALFSFHPRSTDILLEKLIVESWLISMTKAM